MLAPLSLEATAERFIRKPLRQAFVKLCKGSAREYLERFDFKSDLVKAMYAVTDAFSGLDAGYDTPGAGMNTHEAFHLAQLSACRRNSGKGPLV